MGCSFLAGLPPSIQFTGTHLYTWVERGTVKVNCLAQEQRMRSAPARVRALKIEPRPLIQRPVTTSHILMLVLEKRRFNLVSFGSTRFLNRKLLILSLFSSPRHALKIGESFHFPEGGRLKGLPFFAMWANSFLAGKLLSYSLSH